MKKIIQLLLIFIIISNITPLFAATAKYQSDNYNINISYNDTVVPGDAVFVKMIFTLQKFHKKNKNDADKKAVLQFSKDKKIIQTAPFYILPKKNKNQTIEMLCGIPVSPWLVQDNYNLKVIYSINENENKEFNLPINFKMREFDSETIQLNAKNTQIKTDNSPTRLAQIDKLNAILETSIPSDVYSLKAFKVPNPSTRYTAHYGDRRIYAYSNGKSSTSLHYGNDYGIPEGSEVRSCADGKVVMAEERNSTGFSIVIEHLPGLYSLYYHLSAMNVSEGQMVKQGDLIGSSGQTGLATGPHLHWEVRLNASAVRPEFFLENFAFESE